VYKLPFIHYFATHPTTMTMTHSSTWNDRASRKTTFYTMMFALVVSLVVLSSSTYGIPAPCVVLNSQQVPGHIRIALMSVESLFGSMISATRIAIEMVNNDPTLLPNTTLDYVFYDTGLSQAVWPQATLRISCLVSRVSCLVSRVSCLVSRVSCLLHGVQHVKP
jgi:hypothetical protein